jgi:hypothetical protein
VDAVRGLSGLRPYSDLGGGRWLALSSIHEAFRARRARHCCCSERRRSSRRTDLDPPRARISSASFQLLDVPNQPPHLKSSAWPAACQFFRHYPDGYWLHQQTQGRACTNAIPMSKPGLPQTVRWQIVQDGFVLVDRADVNVRELWKVDRVNKPTHLDRTNLNEGDLIMQLLDQSKRVVWIRTAAASRHSRDHLRGAGP